MRATDVLLISPLAIVSLLLAAPLDAQTLFQEELVKQHLPLWQPGQLTRGLAIGDLDGDGDLDLLIGNGEGSPQQNQVFWNDGLGRFADATTGSWPPIQDVTLSIALGDVDGDRDLDAVVGNRGVNSFYLNNGTSVFSPAQQFGSLWSVTESVVLGDVDLDGDLDLVYGNGMRTPQFMVFLPQQNQLYLNDGQGSFSNVTATHLPTRLDPTSSVALGDVDSDGDLDLAIGNGYFDTGVGVSFAEQVRLCLGDGTGRFVDVTATHMPSTSHVTQDVAFADVDGDGDLDLAIAVGNLAGSQNALYVNDGSGLFTDETATRLPIDADYSRDVAVGDADGDGDVDLLFANDGHGTAGGQQDKLYLNNGSGIFTNATAMLPDHGNLQRTRAITVADLDQDDRADVLIGTRRQNRLFAADGRGGFVDATATRLPDSGYEGGAVTAADFDLDGAADLVIGNRLFFNDGHGNFVDRTTSHWNGCRADSLAAGDVDGDGDPDVAAVCLANPKLYANDGTGRFIDVTATSLPTRPAAARTVAMGDVDGDGDLDLAWGDFSRNWLLLNDGFGMFTDVTSSRIPPGPGAWDLELVDVDRDGDLDALLGYPDSSGAQNRLWVNDGYGTFRDETSTHMPSVAGWVVVAGDVDGDGYPDVAVGNRSQNWILRNNGQGRFTVDSSSLPVRSDETMSLAFGDVDEDGDLDLLVGNGVSPNRQQNYLYANDGSGRFVDATATMLPVLADLTEALALVDVDDDGDLDAVLAEHGEAHRLLVNRRRQTTIPWLPRSPGNYLLSVSAVAPLFRLAVPIVGTGELSTPLPPFGTLHIDPAQMLVLRPVYIPPSGNPIEISLHFPKIPNLAGLPWLAQTLVLEPTGTTRFTNAVVDQFVSGK